jgi:hypothetical protein
MDAALRKAMAGDFTELDRIELRYLNLLVRIGDLAVKHADGRSHWWFNPDDERFEVTDDCGYAPFVIAIDRGFDQNARPAMRWALMEKCRRCDGKLRNLPCRVCEGEWYVHGVDDLEVVCTDLDGVLIGEAP